MRCQLIALLATVFLAGCSSALPIDRFAGEGPNFDPMRYWQGHTASWGVIENRSGEPIDIVRTDCVGVLDSSGVLHLHQTLAFSHDKKMTRDWTLRPDAAGHDIATANDMGGDAVGAGAGPAFAWAFILKTRPHNRLFDVRFHQHMYLMPDGTLMNRTIVTKWGFIVAEVTEQFHHITP